MNLRTKLLNDKSKSFIETLPNDVENYSKEQIEWLLYHWHDETSGDFDYKQKIFNKLKLFTCGINGGQYVDTIRQWQFLASKVWFPAFLKYYELFKPVLKCFKSEFDNEEIVLLNMHFGVFNFRNEYDNCQLEISLKYNKGRFVNSYSRYDKPTKWYSFEEILEIFEKYEID